MNKISVVIPDGSMQEPISRLLQGAGIEMTFPRKRVREAHVDVEWISRVVLQRPQEIPHYVENGQFDVAIVGEDWIANWGYKNLPTLFSLPIGRSGDKPVRIILAVKKDSGIKTVADLPEGCEVATEYGKLAKRFFREQGRPDVKVIPSYGNTEHKITLGATGIIDVTENGDSLRDYNLEAIHQLMESHIVVTANPLALADQNKAPYIRCFAQLIKGAYQARRFILVTANVPNEKLDEAAKIINGKKGPSQMPIGKGWVALQSIVERKLEHSVIFQLHQLGVTDIVVVRDIPLIMD